MLIGPRHWDQTMQTQADNIENSTGAFGELDQGFIDQHGVFMTREEAWKVAEAAGQIIKRVGGDDRDGGTLYSENLY
jgi:hypothetical protein